MIATLQAPGDTSTVGASAGVSMANGLGVSGAWGMGESMGDNATDPSYFQASIAYSFGDTTVAASWYSSEDFANEGLGRNRDRHRREPQPSQGRGAGIRGRAELRRRRHGDGNRHRRDGARGRNPRHVLIPQLQPFRGPPPPRGRAFSFSPPSNRPLGHPPPRRGAQTRPRLNLETPDPARARLLEAAVLAERFRKRRPCGRPVPAGRTARTAGSTPPARSARRLPCRQGMGFG